MNWKRGSILLLALLLYMCPEARSQQASDTAGVLLNFQETDLRLVISSLAEMARLPISYGGLPNRAVTLRSSVPVPRKQLRSMLESVVASNGLLLSEENGLIRITQKVEAPQQPQQTARSAAASSAIEMNVYRLRHIRAEAAAATLRELFGQGGNGSAAPVDRPSSRTAAEREQRRARLQNPLAAQSDSTTQRRAVGGEVRGPIQIVPDPATNSLLIRANADDFGVLVDVLGELDIRPLQVLIEVLIAEVRTDKEFDLGISVNVPEHFEPRTNAKIAGEMKSATPGDLAVSVLGLGHVKADVVIRALAASGNVRILSRPIVLTQNNQEARIMVGSQRPFVQVSRALPTDAAVRDQVVQYRDVGTQLSIVPTISPDGYITLSLSQEVSSATTETQFGAPVISTREVQTQLFVKDEHTALIGGLVDRQNDHVRSGIPLLSRIPLIGALFGSTQNRNTTTELFLLLTPHVIRSDEQLDETTGQIRDRSKLLRKDEAKPLIQPHNPEPAEKK